MKKTTLILASTLIAGCQTPNGKFDSIQKDCQNKTTNIIYASHCNEGKEREPAPIPQAIQYPKEILT